MESLRLRPIAVRILSVEGRRLAGVDRARSVRFLTGFGCVFYELFRLTWGVSGAILDSVTLGEY